MFHSNQPEISQGLQDLIFDVSTEDFEARVIAASMEVPVLVDFWAPWCGPCKQLGPALEASVRAAGGKVLMAKVNLDENQQLAAALRIQSVPTVYAFFQGKPIDAFQGALPESQIKSFIANVMKSAAAARPDALDVPEVLSAAAKALADGDIQAAHALYSQILQQDETNAKAYAGLVRVFIATDQIEQAKALVDNAPEEIAKDSGFAEAVSALEFAQMTPTGDFSALEARIQKDPQDHEAYIDLAQGQFAAGKKEQAIETILKSIGIDREWEDQKARKTLLKFFEALGANDPLTIKGRRKLSSILFS